MGGKIGILKEGKCYLLKNLLVREYGSTFLSMAEEGCEHVEIEGIGDTVDEEVLLNYTEVLTDAEIDGVAHRGGDV